MSGTSAAAPRSLLARIAAAWVDFRASTARELAEDPGEPRLLAYALGGCLILWLARAPEVLARDMAQAAAAGVAPTAPAMLLTAHLVSMLFFTPLMLYGVAALSRLVLRGFGGTGDWKATRTAVFWSLLAAAPAFLLAALIGQALSLSGQAQAGTAAGAAGGVVWLWFWSQGLAQAHGFARGWPIFAVMAAAALALQIAAATTSAGG